MEINKVVVIGIDLKQLVFLQVLTIDVVLDMNMFMLQND